MGVAPGAALCLPEIMYLITASTTLLYAMAFMKMQNPFSAALCAEALEKCQFSTAPTWAKPRAKSAERREPCALRREPAFPASPTGGARAE